MADLNLFATINEALNAREEAPKRHPLHALSGFKASDVWDYRTNWQHEDAMRTINTLRDEALKDAIQTRLVRAHTIVDTLSGYISKLTVAGGTEPLIDIEYTQKHYEAVLTEAAKFDYAGANLDEFFALLEFILTHKNPLFIYEAIDWVITDQIIPVIEQETARDKFMMLREVLEMEVPEQIKMIRNAHLLAQRDALGQAAKTPYGHTIDFGEPIDIDSAITEPPIGVEEASNIIAQAAGQAQTVSIDAATVQAGMPKPE